MRILYVCICTLLFIGCAPQNYSANFTLISTDKVNIPSNIKISEIPVEGESCYNTILNPVDKDVSALVRKAVENAIENGNKRGFEGNFLIDAQINQTIKNGFFSHKVCIIAKGKIAKF
ncbi:hypothetical protein [Helicobacter sp. 11S03491-1]|uniref:hypothetical protein n=1 Tax=Helicobacter sp. 11S03491-1 TaxID=1476196 RepID=UPI000BA4F53E|nr:hypothetical protein [Helicobacter sp. 11S03491-1]PAF43710.1 hypothetical protein BKH45_00080 [Helicobacter sp. 11S03491-1]